MGLKNKIEMVVEEKQAHGTWCCLALPLAAQSFGFQPSSALYGLHVYD